MSNSNTSHTSKPDRHQAFLAALRGQHGPQKQQLATCLSVYVKGAVHLLHVDPLETMDLVLSTEDAMIAFAAYIYKPSRKTLAAYVKQFETASGYHMAYAEKCGGVDAYPRTVDIR